MSPDVPELDAPMDPPPVFVGGTGRSGTTVVGDLIGHHSSYHLVPIEVRFHLAPGGLMDVLAADVTLGEFGERMLDGFFARKGPGGRDRGLHQVMERSSVEEATELFMQEYSGGRYAAGRRLMRRLLDPLAEQHHKATWVEMTPGNVGVASKLVRLFPEMKMVHTVRDGRDVASSVMSKDWGPTNIVDAIYWWSERLRDAEAQARMIDDRNLYIAKFDELIFGRRKTAFTLLTRYLGLEAEPEMLEFFDTMTRGKAHLGRWRRDVSDTEEAEIDRLYRAIFSELKQDGLSCVPVEPGALEDSARRRAE